MSVFYLFAAIDALYFYSHKDELVQHLKVEGEDFKKKVDPTITITDIEDDIDDIKFD